VHEESNQGTVSRSVTVGDLVRLTSDGVIAAWYPDIDHNSVGIVISLHALDPFDDEALQHPPDQRRWVTVEWPRGRDSHLIQDLDIVRKYFA
jgi:hypothetical protein